MSAINRFRRSNVFLPHKRIEGRIYAPIGKNYKVYNPLVKISKRVGIEKHDLIGPKRVIHGGFAWAPFFASILAPAAIDLLRGRGFHLQPYSGFRQRIGMPSPFPLEGPYKGYGKRKSRKAKKVGKKVKKGGAVSKGPSKSKILQAIRSELSLQKSGRGLRRL